MDEAAAAYGRVRKHINQLQQDLHTGLLNEEQFAALRSKALEKLASSGTKGQTSGAHPPARTPQRPAAPPAPAKTPSLSGRAFLVSKGFTLSKTFRDGSKIVITDASQVPPSPPKTPDAHKPLSCPKCDRKFCHAGALKTHMRTRHPPTEAEQSALEALIPVFKPRVERPLRPPPSWGDQRSPGRRRRLRLHDEVRDGH